MSTYTALQVSEEQKRKVRESYDVTLEDIAKQVEELKEWIASQSELPTLTDDLLGKFLLRNKFGLEKTKLKIAKYFHLRVYCIDFFEDYYKGVPSKEGAVAVPLPVLTDDCKRIYLTKIEVEMADICNTFRTNFLTSDLTLVYDYPASCVFIVDCKEFAFKNYAKHFSLLERKIRKVAKDAYSARVDKVYFLNVSSILVRVINQLINNFTTKEARKLQIIEKVEELHLYVAKEFLPEEYGGTLGPFREIKENWDRAFVENQDIFKANLAQLNATKLQLKPSTDEELFGPEGTFRTLDVD